MPGYVMHLAEADMILEILREKGQISVQWAEHFMTGNLLPDTRLRKEKKYSHFWNPKEESLMAKAPDLDLFLEKYCPGMDQPLLLGYLMHLDLDARYVHSFWPQCFSFYNREGKPETRAEHITEVEIRKNSQRVTLTEFFSPDFYYGDYSRMNGFFVRKYHIHPPMWKDIRDYHMDEVKLEDMDKICRDLEWLIAHCSSEDEPELRVFDLHQLDSFIRKSAQEFTCQYLQKML